MTSPPYCGQTGQTNQDNRGKIDASNEQKCIDYIHHSVYISHPASMLTTLALLVLCCSDLLVILR